MGAFADAREAVAGRDDPGVRGGTLQVFAEIFEDSGIVGRNGGEVIERFIDAGGDAGGGDVVAENAFIDDVGEEGGLRDEFVQQVRDVLLAIGHEGFVVARAAAEGDHDGLAVLRDHHAAKRRPAEERRGCRGAGHLAKKVAAAGGNSARDFVRTAALLIGEAHATASSMILRRCRDSCWDGPLSDASSVKTVIPRLG